VSIFLRQNAQLFLLKLNQTLKEKIKLKGQHQDAFEALKSYGRANLIALAKSKKGAYWYQQRQLAPLTKKSWHIAFGGNFIAHADETGLERPFAFPKIVGASPSINIITRPHNDVLLDYEVELCMIFDRDIHSNADFNDAQKGVFLCADTTDRTTLLRDLPKDEETFGGTGFTDSKSYKGFFSTGPYLVIPNDWKEFVNNEPITTSMNGVVMQYAHGSDMLLQDGKLKRGSALLSGTGEGVIFRPPTFIDILSGVTAFVFTGSFLKDISGYDYVIEHFIRRHTKAKTFLQVGDIVRHRSKNLGQITFIIE